MECSKCKNGMWKCGENCAEETWTPTFTCVWKTQSDQENTYYTQVINFSTLSPNTETYYIRKDNNDRKEGIFLKKDMYYMYFKKKNNDFSWKINTINIAEIWKH